MVFGGNALVAPCAIGRDAALAPNCAPALVVDAYHWLQIFERPAGRQRVDGQPNATAVGWRLGHLGRADVAAGTGTLFYHHRLAKLSA